ncbi:quinone oxidoreductase [Lentzea sp. DG1S-22]|uniref:quinone oxidoreductase family protein n=1 Tax=Lentzea sp. DG1S-22 TaxID=3108822 RepID=UPI002E797D4B|nr:quinone oxidoreductase [Lentzea sp. DG1S-22]WVH81147.1 quinone oxidoreductase [Lentzea sp. DG1S-22]
MPKAVVVRETGGPEVLEHAEVQARTPGDGELLVRTAAAGVNYIDTYQRSGVYQIPLPTTLGLEGAGEVVVSNSPDFAAGDKVAWMSVLGSYASEVVVPASAAVRVPAELDVELAAASLLQGVTAHYLVHSTYAVKEGDRVLVHAAAGGVGLLLTQWAKSKGAVVVATVSTDEKEALAREAGADQVLRYGDFASQIEKVDVVYDGVGRDTFDQSLASLKPRGLLALFGASSGAVPPVDPQRLNAAGSVFLTRPSTGAYLLDRAEFEWRAADLFGAIASGELNVRVGGRYALEEAAQAHTDLQSRKTTGKLLLLP